jgi:ribosomal protein S19
MRSSYKFFWQPLNLIYWKIRNTKKNNLRIYRKNTIITPKLVGHFLLVYNGNQWIKLRIDENMVGFKVGEFISTRKKPIWKKKK